MTTDLRLHSIPSASYDILHEDGHAPVKSWTRGVLLDDKARDQLLNIAKMPFIHKWVAAMPDVHWGIGATVGSVIPTHGAVIPAAVGVDIGCGMTAVRTTLKPEDLPDDLRPIRHSIERSVPHGRTDNGQRNDRGAWRNAPKQVEHAWSKLAARFDAITSKHSKIAKGTTFEQLGTLGSGNHFIEVCISENKTGDNAVWLMLHSGSRGVGNRIGSYFIELAKHDMRRYFIHLPDDNLAYLPEGTEHFNDYVEAVSWAQDFAKHNRALMMDAVINALKNEQGIPPFELVDEVIDCHHNYVAREHHYGADVLVTRKGAVRAREGDFGIIPGSMGAQSFIVRGRGNPESFHSCSHGAGRAVSRTEAKNRFTIEDHKAATAHVECRKDDGVLDETPAAYKPIETVMHAQRDLVEIVHTLRQVICVKG